MDLIGRPAFLCAAFVASMSACSFGGSSPEAVVRKAGEALRKRNRAEFYDQVDLKTLGSQLIQDLSGSMNDSYTAMRFFAGITNGDFIGGKLGPLFASPPDTSQGGWRTASAVGNIFLGTELSVHGLGKAETSGGTAFVPLFIAIGSDSTPRRVSVQLQKQDSKWRIVGIRDLDLVVREDRRRTAQARGELYTETTREKAYVSGMRSDLRNLTTAQEAYFSEHSTYASSISQVTGYVPSPGIRVTVTAGSANGWTGSATHDSFPGAICSIFIGTPAPPPPAGSTSAPQEGAPYCSTVRP
jgi:hypothetical protein